MFINFDGFKIYLRYVSVDLKSNVTSEPHNDWFYHSLIHARYCQKNFPNLILRKMQQIFYTNNPEATRNPQTLGGKPMKPSEILVVIFVFF